MGADDPSPARGGKRGSDMSTELVLLGTGGGPTPKLQRSSPANAVRVDGSTYIVDCGNGIGRQLVRAGISLDSLAALFVTHHHADHNGDLGALLHAAWNQMSAPVLVTGPPPLERVLAAYFEMQAYDMAMRCASEGRDPLQDLVQINEFTDPGMVYEDDLVKVTAARVQHPPIEYAFSYRFDTADRSIVFSGDTIPLDAVATLAKGADVLVHEAIYTPAVDELAHLFKGPTWRQHMLGGHTSVEDAAGIAAAAGVTTLVLNHLFPPDDSIPEERWIECARERFAGEVVVGRDLLVV
jgi:ribonuclease BN (tRNA processing enzyme)